MIYLTFREWIKMTRARRGDLEEDLVTFPQAEDYMNSQVAPAKKFGSLLAGYKVSTLTVF